jgi:hypothetical protein
MSQDNPTTDTPITNPKPEEIKKPDETETLPEDALDKVVGGSMYIQPRGQG